MYDRGGALYPVVDTKDDGSALVPKYDSNINTIIENKPSAIGFDASRNKNITGWFSL